MTITTALMGLLQAQGTDNARDYLKTYLANSLASIDAHDHSSTKGAPVKRIQNGLFASRPAAGNAGHVYAATDSNQWFVDNGTSWIEAAVLSSLANFSAGLEVSAGNVGIGTAPVAGAHIVTSTHDILTLGSGASGWGGAYAMTGAYVSVTGAVASITSVGGTVIVMGAIPMSASAGPLDTDIGISVDGGAAIQLSRVSLGTAYNEWPFFFAHTPAGGAHTYQIQLKAGAGPTVTVDGANLNQLLCIEAR